MTGWCLLLLLLQTPETAPIDRARALLADRQYVLAEAYFLSSDLKEDQIGEVGESLAGIALKLGTFAQKKAFYQELLLRDSQWRRTSLLVLSIFAAREQEWHDFQTYAVQFFGSVDRRDPALSLRLIYYLARYTTQLPEGLELTNVERQWFTACRRMGPEATFPRGGIPGLPVYLRHAHLLNRKAPFALPSVSFEGSAEAQYFGHLIAIRHHINSGDGNQAARGMNALLPLDRRLNQPYLHFLYLQLLADYYRLRGYEDKLAEMPERLAATRDRAVLPFVAYPEAHVDEAAIEAANRVPLIPEKPLEETPISEAEQLPPDASDQAAADPKEADQGVDGVATGELALIDLESRLSRDPAAVLEALKTVPGGNLYRETYKAYLHGAATLAQGHRPSALLSLQAAQDKVRSLPFPLLEIKILLSLGDYYDLENNRSKADWMRIQATQIWMESETLATLQFDTDAVPRNPFKAMIDVALTRITEPETFAQLLFAGEAAHFTRIRQKAFARNALNANPVLGHQLLEIGRQLNVLREDLIIRRGDAPSPRRYNDTLGLWHQLWEKILPSYRELDVPSTVELQRRLDRNGRILSFIEGEKQLGVLILTPTQAFAVALGEKDNYLALAPENRFQYLERRLGPLWQRAGAITLSLSKTFRTTGLLQGIRQKAEASGTLKIVFSLRAFNRRGKEASSCLNAGVFSIKNSGQVQTLIQTLPTAGLRWLAGGTYNVDQLAELLPHTDHLFFLGDFKLDPEGLNLLGEEEEPFWLHQIVQYRQDPCSLTIFIPNFSAWEALLDELELSDPYKTTAIRLGNHVDNLRDKPLSGLTSGIQFLE